MMAIAGSLFFLIHKPAEKAGQAAINASEALGLRAGEEVAQLLGNKGQVGLFELETKPGQAPTAVATVQMFRRTLKKHGVAVARSKAVPGGLTTLVMGGGISRNDYVALVEGSPGLAAVVTFAGLPNWPTDELRQFQATHPPLVVVDIFGVAKGTILAGLVEQRAVALAFSPLSATEVQQEGEQSKIFERYYRILRPESK